MAEWWGLKLHYRITSHVRACILHDIYQLAHVLSSHKWSKYPTSFHGAAHGEQPQPQFSSVPFICCERGGTSENNRAETALTITVTLHLPKLVSVSFLNNTDPPVSHTMTTCWKTINAHWSEGGRGSWINRWQYICGARFYLGFFSLFTENA